MLLQDCQVPFRQFDEKGSTLFAGTGAVFSGRRTRGAGFIDEFGGLGRRTARAPAGAAQSRKTIGIDMNSDIPKRFADRCFAMVPPSWRDQERGGASSLTQDRNPLRL